MANDTLGLNASSPTRSDLLDLYGMPPTVVVTNPVFGNYSGIINITYIAISPNNYTIMNYSILLVDENGTFVQDIIANTTLNYYEWDSTTTVNNTYVIKVYAYDSSSQRGMGISDYFNITHIWWNTTSWNGTVYNKTTANTITIWNGTIFNSSVWINRTAWNGTLFNDTIWNGISWNGNLWNGSHRWWPKGNWNGCVYNGTGASGGVTQDDVPMLVIGLLLGSLFFGSWFITKRRRRKKR